MAQIRRVYDVRGSDRSPRRDPRPTEIFTLPHAVSENTRIGQLTPDPPGSWILAPGSFFLLLVLPVLLVLLVHFVPMDPYQKLLERFKEVQLLKSTSAGLEWDEQTYLPKKAVHYRAEQLSYLASKAHLLGTAPEVGEWLSACEQIGYPEGSGSGAQHFSLET